MLSQSVSIAQVWGIAEFSVLLCCLIKCVCEWKWLEPRPNYIHQNVILWQNGRLCNFKVFRKVVKMVWKKWNDGMYNLYNSFRYYISKDNLHTNCWWQEGSNRKILNIWVIHSFYMHTHPPQNVIQLDCCLFVLSSYKQRLYKYKSLMAN